MKSVQELDKEIDVLREKQENKYEEINKIEKEKEKFKEQKLKLYSKFEKDVKKLFGIVDVKIKHSEYDFEVKTDDVILYQYDSEKMEYSLIGLKNAMKLKSMYEEVYGEPKNGYEMTCGTTTIDQQDGLIHSLGNNIFGVR